MVKSYANNLSWYNSNQSIYWFHRLFHLALYFFVALVIVLPLFYIFNAELSLQNVGYILLTSIAISIVASGIHISMVDHFKRGRPLHPHFARYYQHYLMNQIIIKEVLEQINSLYPQETTEIPKLKQIAGNKNPKKILSTTSSIPDEYDFPHNEFSDTNNKKIVNKVKKNSAEEITEKIEEVNKRLVEYDNSQNSNKEIVWKVKKNENKFIEIIYHPLQDIFKIIELWTLDPAKKALNGHHFMIWNEEKIKSCMGKKHEQLYPGFFRIGQIGRIANPIDDQGYVNCKHYIKNSSWKLKSQSTPFELFFNVVSTTPGNSEKNKSQAKNSNEDSEKLTLYDAVNFNNPHPK